MKVKLQTLVQADATLSEFSQKLRLVSAVRPLNEPEQKQGFLQGRIREPRFVYAPPAPLNCAEIRNLRLPETYWGSQLALVRRRLLRLNSIFQDPGPLDVRDYSREVYGAPSERLRTAARTLLGKIEFRPQETVTWEFTSRVLQGALDHYGLRGWTVRPAPGDFTAARAVEKTVYLTPVGALYQGTAERLAVHEVGIHAVRAHNGARQDLSHFGIGWPDYESTEEGLAVYSELLTGTISEQALLNYSARVVAVSELDRGRSFRDCYESLRDLELSPNQAWEATLRAYRGNGFFKDHLYLQGLFEVFQYVRSGGDLTTLMVGKVGLRHLSQVRADLATGALQAPSVVPGFLTAAPATGPLWSLMERLAVG